MSKKLFIVRKYIMAKDASEAIKLDKKHPVDDVWVEEDWKRNNLTNQIGYSKK